VLTRHSIRMIGAALILVLMCVSTAMAYYQETYLWNNATPTLALDCHDIKTIGDLGCPSFMNCSTVTFHPYVPTHIPRFGGVDGVVCSKLTIGVQRLVNNYPMPIQWSNVSVSGTIRCEVIVEGQDLGTALMVVQMSGKTATNGTVSFLMPSRLVGGNEPCQSFAYTASQGGALVIESSSGLVSTIQWPSQNTTTVWLPPVFRSVLRIGCGPRCFIV
jgi:hypothetical protein